MAGALDAADAWRRYPKITEQAQDSPTTAEWIALEKYHGANFSVVCDRAGRVRFAKRSGLLADGEDFYSFRSRGVGRALEGLARGVFERVAKLWGREDGLEVVIVYGELLGGHYPHDDVPAIPGLKPVQHGVWYSPDLLFVAFDVQVTPAPGGRSGPAAPAGPVAGEGPAAAFLSADAARAACEGAGLRFAAEVARGRYNDLASMDVRFESTLPPALGLPSLPGNWAEGVVLRPASEPRGGASRGLVKRKIPEFSEKQYQNASWAVAKAGGSARAPADSSDPSLVLRYELQACITHQRVDAAVSKLGLPGLGDKEGCRAVLAEFEADVVQVLEDEGTLPGGREALVSLGLDEELSQQARQVVAARLRALHKGAGGSGASSPE